MLAFKESDKALVDGAIGVLGEIGKPAVPALMEALKDRNLEMRGGAQEALARIGTDAVSDLLQALKDRDGETNREAAAVLLKVDPAQLKELELAWSKALAGPGRERLEAIATLEKMGKEAVPALIQVLRDQDESVRKTAAGALGRLGPAAREASTPLQRLAKEDPSASVREKAAEAVAKIGGDKSAAPGP